MKIKHNKKRNTAFTYEALMRCLTESVVKKDNDRKAKIIAILKEFFHDGAILRQEMNLYNSLIETAGLDVLLAERFIFESKKAYNNLDLQNIFKTQTSMIKKINTELGKDFFSVFVPNYKNYANVSHIFNKKTDPKTRVILERKIVTSLISRPDAKEDNEFYHLDALTYKTYVNKFNEKYTDDLLEEQKNLLSMYITSFNDGGVEFRYFINEEISRIKEKLSSVVQKKPEIAGVLEKIDSLKEKRFSDADLQMILKTQQLVKELE